MANVLVWPDHHQPWGHPKALEHLCRIRDKYKCETVVNLGDEFDLASFAVKWPINPDLPSPGDELKMAIEKMQPFYKEFPKVKVCHSNHASRLFRKAICAGFPVSVLRRYREIFEYPEGWELAEFWEIQNILYIHGDSFNRTSWRDGCHKLKQSFVCGHSHSGAGVIYSQGRKQRLFSAQFGCLIDPHAMAFEYGKHSLEKPVIGCGVVIDDGETAIFEPMPPKLL